LSVQQFQTTHQILRLHELRKRARRLVAKVTLAIRRGTGYTSWLGRLVGFGRPLRDLVVTGICAAVAHFAIGHLHAVPAQPADIVVRQQGAAN
jgi:hypothetical protein